MDGGGGFDGVAFEDWGVRVRVRRGGVDMWGGGCVVG